MKLTEKGVQLIYMKLTNLYLALISLLTDLTAVFLGMVVAYIWKAQGAEIYLWPFEHYLRFVLIVLPIWLALFASQGLYNPRALPRGWSGFGRLLIGLVAGWGMLLIILYFWRSPQAQAFPRLLVIYGIVATTVLTVVGRWLINIIVDVLYRMGRGVTRTVVIGNHGNDTFVKNLSSNWIHGRKVLAVLSTGEAIEQLEALSKKEKIEEVVVTQQNITDEKLLEVLNWAEMHGANFALVPSLLSVRATNVETTTLAGTPIMFFLRTPLEGWRRIYKRLLDLVIVTPTMIILLPVYILVAFLVAVTSKGPVIFIQERVGQDGRKLQLHKFRSMFVNGDKEHNHDWSSNERTDPRVTPLGRFLRRSNLDELPQLWDVFIGAMSLVGPRPEQPKYVEKFSKEVPEYLKRHNVKSGLTGWAQVNGLRGDTSIPERVKYDLYYIENWSIWFDLRIIVATALYLVSKDDTKAA